MVKSAQQQATRPVPVYATTGPASWALAYELAAFLVDYDGAGEGASGGDPAETRRRHGRSGSRWWTQWATSRTRAERDPRSVRGCLPCCATRAGG